MSSRKNSGQKRADKVNKRRKKKEKQPSSLRRGESPARSVTTDVDELFEEAMECEDYSRAMDLFQQVVRIDPGHLDAWIEIAHGEDDDAKSIAVLQTAIRHGEKELREDLKHNRGHFWGLYHTRPYMRARHALSELYLDQGDLPEAVREMEDILDLNPNDNQGIRWKLMELYCRLDAIDEAEQLLSKYPDEGLPFLPFTAVLLRFRRQGDTPELRQMLVERVENNPYLIPRMLDPRMINVSEIAMFSPGSEEEADLYCQQFLSVWKSTPGAISWLRGVAHEQNLDGPEAPAIDYKKEIQRLRNQVKKLPVCSENWIVEATVVEEADVVQGWLLAVVDAGSENPLLCEPGEDPLSTDTLLYGLLNTMLSPDEGEPRRPAEIGFLDRTWQTAVAQRLSRLDIRTFYTDERPEFLKMLARSSTGVMGQAADFDRAKCLPKGSVEWIVAWQQMQIWIPDASGDPVQPWMILILAPESGFILGQQMTLDLPGVAEFQTVFAQAAFNEQIDEPCLPSLIRVSTADHRAGIQDVAAELDISVRICECPEAVDAFDSLSEHLRGGNSGPCALVETENATPSMVGDFYEAAAIYTKSKIWMTTHPETVVDVHCPELIDQHWYAVVMGQMGQELGIIFFDDMQTVNRLMNQHRDDADSGAAKLQGIALSLDEKSAISPKDVAAAEQFGWPVAAREAWPTAYCVSNSELRPVSEVQLRFLPAAILAVTERLTSKEKAGTTVVKLHDRLVKVLTLQTK